MNVLVMNHSFEHDIDSLRAATPQWRWRVISLEFFYREALRVFGEEVSASIVAYTSDAYAEARAEYREVLAGLLEDLYLEEPFDVFVVPSDSYFYLREAHHACHRLGVPFLVVQKETTIAPWNMEQGSRALRDHAPLIADHMTVCSEHHRDYWLRAGADARRMTVTGQPRFDFYARERHVTLPYPGDGPTVLFFTYLPDFYHPNVVMSEERGPWQELLDRTEQGLWELAADGCRVLVKPHPLQPFRAEARRIKHEVGDLFGKNVFTVDPATDVRSLIAGSDVAVGFQSTVMFEAMVAGIGVVYTFWDPEAARIADTMVEYHEMGHAIEVVTRAEQFTDAVKGARKAPWGSELWKERRRLAEPQLGPLDGEASARAAAVIAREVDAFQRAAGERRALSRSRPSRRLRRYRARERAIRVASRVRRAVAGSDLS